MIKGAVFFAGLLPLAYSLYQVYLLQSDGAHSLGADPGKELLHMQGEWAIRFLMLTLLVSPVRRLTPWKGVIRLRRMLGLFTFFYASLHLAAYLVFLLQLDFGALGDDLVKRPYILAGFSAFLLMVPLAVTSTDSMMRRLRRRWQQLHRLIYGVAALAVLHLFWLAKASYAEAVAYGALAALLLAYRAVQARQRRIQEP